MDTRDLYQELKRRPTATTVTVRELVQRAESGRIRVPVFQRPLRWQNAQVVELLDSIWRGYPIGSLLFWKREADAGDVRIGNALFQSEAISDAWWVVDGQQRLTALAASLSDLDQRGDRRWALHFCPETAEFYGGAQQHPDHVPLSKLGDLKRLGRWLRDTTLTDELADRVEEAQQRILDYSVPAYIVETDDEQALRAVFARLNSTGSRMRAEEVFQALLGASSHVDSDSLDLGFLQTACTKSGFGTPPLSEILKSVLAMSGIDPTRNLADMSQSLDQLINREDAFDAIQRSSYFLMEDCGIPHFNLVPYPVVFFILARWFHIFPNTPDAIRKLLARWVWRGAVGGSHQRSAVSGMRQQVRDIVEQDGCETSLRRLLSRVQADDNVIDWKLEKFNSKSARSRIETLALLDLNPSNALGAISVDTMLESGRIAREIFSTSDCKNQTPKARELAKTAANRVILESRHTGLHPEMREWALESDNWDSHLVSPIARQYLLAGNIADFLEERGNALTIQVRDFLLRGCKFDEPIVFPGHDHDADLAV